MKVNFQTARLLQLKQSKWLPWYWQLLLWPTVLVLLLMSLAAQESKLTCRKAEGKCQLESQTLAAKEVKTINIDNIQKIDLEATDDADTSSLAQLVLLGKDGSKVKVGDSASYATMDEMAAKLSWFLESSTAQYFELSDSNVWLTRFLGLTGGAGIFWFFWRGGTRVVTFDRDRQLCTVEQRQLFRNKFHDYPLNPSQTINLLESVKPVGQNMVLQDTRAAFNLKTIFQLNDKVLPLAKHQQNAQLADRISLFLNLSISNRHDHDSIGSETSDYQAVETWDSYSTSSETIRESSSSDNSYSDSDSSDSSSSSSSDS